MTSDPDDPGSGRPEPASPEPAAAPADGAAAPAPSGPLPAADVSSRARLAREALAAAKADALARGSRPARAPGAPRAGAAAGLPRSATSQHRRDDPQPLASAIEGLIGDSGWELAAATGSVFGGGRRSSAPNWLRTPPPRACPAAS